MTLNEIKSHLLNNYASDKYAVKFVELIDKQGIFKAASYLILIYLPKEVQEIVERYVAEHIKEIEMNIELYSILGNPYVQKEHYKMLHDCCGDVRTVAGIDYIPELDMTITHEWDGWTPEGLGELIFKYNCYCFWKGKFNDPECIKSDKPVRFMD